MIPQMLGIVKECIKCLFMFQFSCKRYQIKGVDVQNLFRHVYAKEKRLVFSLVTIATKMANFANFFDF